MTVQLTLLVRRRSALQAVTAEPAEVSPSTTTRALSFAEEMTSKVDSLASGSSGEKPTRDQVLGACTGKWSHISAHLLVR